VSVAVPARLGTLSSPVAGLVPVSLAEANALLSEWGHYLGPVIRPFRSEAWALDLDDRPVAVAVSCSIVSEQVAGYGKAEVVELARLCSADRVWTRIMLRLWREVCAPRWQSPSPRAGLPPLAAIAYSQNARHDGTIYRFDGWSKLTDKAGSSGGGAWSRPRYAGDAVHGRKTLWIWRYSEAGPEGKP
jgi:hypothetical protein